MTNHPRDVLSAGAVDLAPRLLDAMLTSDIDGARVAVRVTEVEAYDGSHDPGSHAYRGRTRRNAVMFGPPGHAYVYFVYGMHWCMNVVCGSEGLASAVLLRAAEVVDGVEVVKERRAGRPVSVSSLASGPARLARALGVTGELDGTDLLAQGPLHLAMPDIAMTASDPRVAVGPRVGVAGEGAATPWRFWIAGDPTVSAYRAAVPRRRHREEMPRRSRDGLEG